MNQQADLINSDLQVPSEYSDKNEHFLNTYDSNGTMRCVLGLSA